MKEIVSRKNSKRKYFNERRDNVNEVQNPVKNRKMLRDFIEQPSERIEFFKFTDNSVKAKVGILFKNIPLTNMFLRIKH